MGRNGCGGNWVLLYRTGHAQQIFNQFSASERPMPAHICVCIHIYIQKLFQLSAKIYYESKTVTHTKTATYAKMYTYICTHTYIWVYMCTHTYIYTHTYTYILMGTLSGFCYEP